MRAALAVLAREAIRHSPPYPAYPGRQPWQFAAGLAAAVAQGSAIAGEVVAAALKLSDEVMSFRLLAEAAMAVDAFAEAEMRSLDGEATLPRKERSEAVTALIRAVKIVDGGSSRGLARADTVAAWSQAAWERDRSRAVENFPSVREDPLGDTVDFSSNGPFGEIWPWECHPDWEAAWDGTMRFILRRRPVGLVYDADEVVAGGDVPDAPGIMAWYSVDSAADDVPGKVDKFFPDGSDGSRSPRLMTYVGTSAISYETEVGLLRRGVRLLLPEDFGGEPPHERRDFFIRLQQLLTHAELGIGPEHRPVSEPALASVALAPAHVPSNASSRLPAGPRIVAELGAADDEEDAFEDDLTPQQLARANRELAALVALAGDTLPWDGPHGRDRISPDDSAQEPKGSSLEPGW